MSQIDATTMSAVRITMISIVPITTDNTTSHTGAPLLGTGGMAVVVLTLLGTGGMTVVVLIL